jgi:hypothetical protein
MPARSTDGPQGAQGPLTGFSRYRTGDHRVGLRVDAIQTVSIITSALRRDVYD